MLFSYNWLKEYVPKLPDPKIIASELTTHAVEVEEVRPVGNFNNIVVGRIDTVEKHPNADRLRVCRVNAGDTTYTVVCGGSNLEVGMRIALAKIGSHVKWHGEGDFIELKPATIRGVASEGMICASVEIGLAEQFPAKEDREILDLTTTNAKPGTPLDVLFGTDTLIDIDNKSMTHRPDLFSHRGMAREMGAVFHLPVKLPRLTPVPSISKKVPVEVQDTAACRRYIGIEMDVQVGPTPAFMRTRLESCGMKSINNVVDITNYILLEFGQPVHAFDAEKLEGKIVVRRAKKGEKIATLDHEVHELDQQILVIADEKKALAIAGIIGGTESAVTENTKRIILEVAHFDAFVTRKASQQIGVRTEGTLRWEKGPSEDMPTYSAPAAVELLKTYAGATVLGVTDHYSKKKKNTTVSVSGEAIHRLTGLHIPSREVKAILERLECAVKVTGGKASEKYTVTAPWFRMDLRIPEDIIEELVRLYGIDRVPQQKLIATLSTPEHDPEIVAMRQIRTALATRGCTEIYNYSFYGDDIVKAVGLRTDAEHVEMLNPLSDDQKYLRVSVLPRMLETVARNQHRADQLSFFELGHVYFADREVRQLGIMVMDPSNAYRKVRGIAESLLSHLHIPFTTMHMQRTENCEFWGMYARNAGMRIDVNRVAIGSMGDVDAEVLDHMDVSTPVAFCVLSVNALARSQEKNLRMAPLPEYPAIPLDLSLIMDQRTPWSDIEKVVRSCAKDLLGSITVFDVYTGKGIPEGKRSITFRMILQSTKRTLEMAEMEKLRDKIVDEASKKIDAKIRAV